jgi:hypothetical protein
MFMFLPLLYATSAVQFPTGGPDRPINAATYAEQLKRGAVATWAEFGKVEAQYSKVWPNMIAQVSGASHSFDHVRLRVSGDDFTMDDTFAKLDAPVQDSLAAGLNVVVAYKGWVNATTTKEAHDQIVEWWGHTAWHYANTTHRLAFDIFIEIGGLMCNGANVPKSCPVEAIATNTNSLNALYSDVVDAIRKVSPSRVIMLTPGKLDRPWNFDTLVVPQGCGDYCMGEFHIIASGPCVKGCKDTKGDFSWTGDNGTTAEHEKIQDAVQDAASWREGKGGLPVWTGAFMPGPYNHPEKGSMTMQAQINFATFYVTTLQRQNIGWAVLVAGDLLDETSGDHASWIADEVPLRNALLGVP